MQSRGGIASLTRKRTSWTWEEVQFEWRQAFQAGVLMTAKSPLFFLETDEIQATAFSRLQCSCALSPMAPWLLLFCTMQIRSSSIIKGTWAIVGLPSI